VGVFDIVTCTNCGNENRVMSEKMEVAKCAVCKERLKGGTLYEVLEIPQTSSQQGIREAYRILAMQWHPDRNIDNVKVATAKIKQINAAYDVLSNEVSRARYDSMLKNQFTEQNSSSNTSHSNTSSQHRAKQNESRQSASYSKPKKDTARTTKEDTSTSAQSHSNQPAQKWSKEINIKITPIRIAYSVFLLGCMVVFIIVFVSDKGESSTAAVDTATNDQPVDIQAVSTAPVKQAQQYTDKTKEGEPPIEKQQSNMFQEKQPELKVTSTQKEKDEIVATEVPKTSTIHDQYKPRANNQTSEPPTTPAPTKNVTTPPAKSTVQADIPDESTAVVKPSTFKVGSSKAAVKAVMGDPDGVHDYSYFVVWDYGLSTVTFDAKGNVKSWANIGNGKVFMGNAKSGKTFKVQSSQQAVIEALGTPDSLNDYEYFVVWSYGLATVTIDSNGKVKGWSNITNGKAYMGSAIAGASKIADGSTKKDVINLLGTPDSVNDYDYFVVWSYGLNSVTFDENGKVKSYTFN
jgi:DnaJ-domain-containing protein 1